MHKFIIFLITTMLIVSCMGNVKHTHTHINFLQSSSPNVAYYRLYVSEFPKKVTNRSKKFTIKDGLNTGEFDDATKRMSIDLTELIGKGSYYIGVSSVSVDDEESKIRILDKVVVVE